MQFLTRSEAKQIGVGRYFTGKECLHGHISERITENGVCVECQLYRSAKYKETEQYLATRTQYNNDYYHDNKVLKGPKQSKYGIGINLGKSEYDKQYRNIKKTEMSAKSKLYNRRMKTENPAKALYLQAKKRAKDTDLEFNIEIKDIVIPEYCPVFGFKLEFRFDGRHHATPSLDRIDSSKGYIKGNIQVISWRANNLKRDATYEEIQMLANFMKTELKQGLI